MKKYRNIISISLLLILVVSIIVGCVRRGDSPEPQHLTESDVGYELHYVEGMPCMRFYRPVGETVWDYDGWSCDWSQWQGR